MEHGVPQGSVLGPLFFILFISDLPLHFSSQVDLYADDTTLTASTSKGRKMQETTFDGGSLASRIDEERSQLRYVEIGRAHV